MDFCDEKFIAMEYMTPLDEAEKIKVNFWSLLERWGEMDYDYSTCYCRWNWTSNGRSNS